jgi:hypothetical protein
MNRRLANLEFTLFRPIMGFLMVKGLFPAGREAIISQFRVWPFLSTIIVTSGERNRNPGHHFAGVYIIYDIFI